MSELYLGDQLITPVVMETVIAEGVSNYNDLDDKPTINDVELVGNKTLDELGIQPKGDYALVEDIPDTSNLATKDEIPSLDDYVKNTDIAGEGVLGLVMTSNLKGIAVDSTGKMQIIPATEGIIDSRTSGNRALTMHMLDYGVKVGVTDNSITLTDEEKASAKAWLGYADNTDIMQAIAAIPQFKLSIVDVLPETGEKMMLYLVPKEGSGNDVYNEYIWIDDTLSFEFIGTTAVDLTDYVKNTDYASYSTAGVVKVHSGTYGLSLNTTNGVIHTAKATETMINTKTSQYHPIVPYNLDYAVKTSVTTNTIGLTDNEKASAQSWLGVNKTVTLDTNQTITGLKLFENGIKIGGYAGIRDNNDEPLIYVDTTHNGWTIGSNNSGGWFTDVHIKRGKSGNYINIDSGNVADYVPKLQSITQADYDALTTKDSNTLYLIEEE